MIGRALLIAAGAAGLAMVLILVGKNRKSMKDVKKENERFQGLLNQIKAKKEELARLEEST